MKKFLSVLLVFVISFIIFQNNAFAEIKNSSEIITGTYQYNAIEGNNKQNKNTFIYKDSDFTKSSFKGSKSLEVLSIQVAGSSLSWYGDKEDKYEIDFSQNDYNIKNFLNKMKFSDIESNKYYNSEKKENSVGVIIGHKTIIQDGKEYTLLAIIPRSAGYKQEWAGNFTISDGNVHEGFKMARDEILRFTKKYLEKNSIKGDLKVWTTGYSRGAAISNMVGGFFAGGGIEYFGDNVSITPEDVYCYTIGTPSSIKNGTSKNIELSVSANRSNSDYFNDTKGEAFNYTKGGIVSVNDSVYNGIRNIISSDDAFALLPPENWGFTRYGKVISSNEGLYSEEVMLKELKSVSEYVYNAYTTDGKRTKFAEKSFDLKTLNIIDKDSNVSQIDFFNGRLNALTAKIGTNKIYNDKYQVALKSIIGTYGMAAAFIDDISEDSDMETSEMIYPLIYTYLAYISDELQSEGKASNEKEAVSIAIEDLLTHFTGTQIDREAFTIDDFVKIVLKYVSDSEDQPISDKVVSGIVSIVPDDYKGLLPMILNPFTIDENPKIEEALKAFIRACYYGPNPESPAYTAYQTPEATRQLLYMTMVMAIGTDVPELQDLIQGESGLDGHGKFEDFVGVMLNQVMQEKNEQGEVIETYSNISELADKELSDLFENLLQKSIYKSEELYGEEYKNDFQKQVNNVKQNITKVREILSALFFYTDNGYDTVESLENTLTFIQNAALMAMPHFDEIYLSLSRTSNRYDDENDCIKGNNQTISLSKITNLVLTFDFDYYLFKDSGSLYIDGIELSKDKYTISKGSTVITIDSSYLNTLQEGNHTVVAKLNNKEVNANFTISNSSSSNPDESSASDNGNNSEKNPETGDNIMFYLIILGLIIIGLAGAGNTLRKEIIDKKQD